MTVSDAFAAPVTPARWAAAPWVTHERLDDEVMAIDLETGAYYALDDSAADAWTVLAAGASLSEAAAAVALRYGVDPGGVEDDLARYVDELVSTRLLVERTDDESGEIPTLPPLGASAAYAPPTVNKYDDLEELLRLDPVHEVDEVGWPVPKRD